jgi:hypothetical protein
LPIVTSAKSSYDHGQRHYPPPSRIDNGLIKIVTESAGLIAEKIRLDDEYGPVDLTQYEIMSLMDDNGEKALFGNSPQRQQRRALGLQFKATHQRMIDWKRDERNLRLLTPEARNKSLALWNTCWLYYLTEVYLEDTSKTEIQEAAIQVLAHCEQPDLEDIFLGWVSVFGSKLGVNVVY